MRWNIVLLPVNGRIARELFNKKKTVVLINIMAESPAETMSFGVIFHRSLVFYIKNYPKNARLRNCLCKIKPL